MIPTVALGVAIWTLGVAVVFAFFALAAAIGVATQRELAEKYTVEKR